ncbi:hypothetical protein [Candidatus Entotheonella palauensis]|uniref:hypothetical protein n=1 Tax=Candidatus Entotheonella palauensis TaxID=93172 RepID=UPI001177F823|nr:hypothetical protein [Candidatus Entotheonella palauensis]
MASWITVRLGTSRLYYFLTMSLYRITITATTHRAIQRITRMWLTCIRPLRMPMTQMSIPILRWRLARVPVSQMYRVSWH